MRSKIIYERFKGKLKIYQKSITSITCLLIRFLPLYRMWKNLLTWSNKLFISWVTSMYQENMWQNLPNPNPPKKRLSSWDTLLIAIWALVVIVLLVLLILESYEERLASWWSSLLSSPSSSTQTIQAWPALDISPSPLPEWSDNNSSSELWDPVPSSSIQL